MSWYSVPVFKVVDGQLEAPWIELCNTLGEASKYMRSQAFETVAYEIGDDGNHTGIVMRLAPNDDESLLDDDPQKAAADLLRARLSTPEGKRALSMSLVDHIEASRRKYRPIDRYPPSKD